MNHATRVAACTGPSRNQKALATPVKLLRNGCKENGSERSITVEVVWSHSINKPSIAAGAAPPIG
jgi:hypothetical protein